MFVKLGKKKCPVLKVLLDSTVRRRRKRFLRTSVVKLLTTGMLNEVYVC